jgi:hypothetical protein
MPPANAGTTDRVKVWVEQAHRIDSKQARDDAFAAISQALQSTDSELMLSGLKATATLRDIAFDKAPLRNAARPHLDSPDPAVRAAAVIAVMGTDPDATDQQRILALVPKATLGESRALAWALAQFSKLDFTGEYAKPMLHLLMLGTSPEAVAARFDNRDVLAPLWGARLSPAMEARVIELSRLADPAARGHHPVDLSYNAMYFALSTQANKSRASVERLLELITDSDTTNVAGRALTGLRNGFPDEMNSLVAPAVIHLLEQRTDEYLWKQGLAVLAEHATRKDLPALQSLRDQGGMRDPWKEALAGIIATAGQRP